MLEVDACESCRCTLTPDSSGCLVVLLAGLGLTNGLTMTSWPRSNSGNRSSSSWRSLSFSYNIVDFCHINFPQVWERERGKKVGGVANRSRVQTKSAFSSVFCRLHTHKHTQRFDSIINMFALWHMRYPLSLLSLIPHALSLFLIPSSHFFSPFSSSFLLFSLCPTPFRHLLCASGQRIF